MTISSDIGRLRDEIERAAYQGLLEAAEQIKATSDADVPVGDPADDPAPGVALARESRIERTPDSRIITIHYPVPYAAKQHEAQSFNHPRGGKSKFLSDAVKQHLPEIEDVVAGTVRARLRNPR